MWVRLMVSCMCDGGACVSSSEYTAHAQVSHAQVPHAQVPHVQVPRETLDRETLDRETLDRETLDRETCRACDSFKKSHTPGGVSPFLMRSLHTVYPAVDLAEKPRIGV